MQLNGSRLRTVAVAGVCVLGLTAAAAGAAIEGQGVRDVRIYAEFRDASPIIKGNDVKVSGVKVGQGESISVRNGRARLGLRLDPAALPVHTDAKATIRPVSLLGERYVELDRGSPSAPVLRDGGVIPVGQTGRATDLDEILSAVDQPTGKGLAALVTALGEGMRGQGKEADAAIAALATSMTQTDALVRILAEQNQLLTSLVDRVQPVAGALAVDQGRSLDRLVGSTELMLRATADNREALEAALDRLPATLAKAERTLARLSGVAESATPTLASIRPVTDDLTDISTELQRFADATDPALASLQPVLEHAQRLLDEAAPVVRSLQPAGQDLRGVAKSARPLAEDLTDNLRNVLDFIRFWALTTNGYDGLSHYFRAHIVISPEIVTGPVPGVGGKVKTPKLDLTKPTLPKLPGVPQLGTPEAGNVTGLTPDQEKSLMNQLLGGL